MTRRLKSQWEFGELFPAEAVRKVLTVGEITGAIRRLLEKELGRVSVMGELTNLRIQSSGHVYFSIKDAAAQLACVMFRTEAQLASRAVFQEGQKVVVDGEVTVYEARGQYQLRAFAIQPQGVGALQAAFERLKLKLEAEGLFAQSHKRPLPRYPQRIGLVTSPDGAAVRDVLHAIGRRNPSLQAILAPCRVQGAGAAQEIAAAIQLLNDWSRATPAGAEAILLTRGGGSLEDLWAFNEEAVARAIYNSALPVVSAVGHEIDFTIADFTADVRAATPTAGAEILTEGIYSVRPYLMEIGRQLRFLADEALEKRAERLGEQLRHLARTHPQRRLHEQAQRIDGLQNTLNRCLRHRFAQCQNRSAQARGRLARVRPGSLLVQRKERLRTAAQRLRESARDRLEARAARLRAAEMRLALLSPGNVLERGYSITLSNGKVVRRPADAPPGAVLTTMLAGGAVESVVRPGGAPAATP